MKLTSNNLLETLNYEELKNLTKEVRETIAVVNTKSAKKVFTSADLWNVQRRRRFINARRNA